MATLTRPEGTETEDLALSRRAVLIAAGYAAFDVAANAEPIRTPDTGLVTGWETLPGGLPAFVARPSAKGKHPAVIVVNEIFGVHEWIKDVCRRFAQAGYVAIAPEYFYRGDPDHVLASSMDFAVIRPIVAKAGLEQVMGDTRTTIDWLGSRGFVNKKKLAITGFCWGGGITWMAASRFPEIKAGGAWYGGLKGNPGPEGRKFPMDVVADLKAPVLGLYGALDKGIPVADVEAMQAKLKGTKSSIILYPDADHGFLADYRPSYNAAAGKDAWAKLLKHFKANGV
ncbi:dienelactone hydrolase family protein [Sandarakinorhabdus oryzae]|uniref:dienelactone hydrolase family protein n=1 Tax=Sandarakinorhabdus oryzae TaxID=2675220 RepID=UPI0012E28913|nr:dienelactone hydrolase family protein [Sandarakinorhabdus oryzae]